MITQLEIKNFRGFSEYKIDDVGQVNLLVGTNNCGKTSILEAVQLLKSSGDPYVLFSILAQRGEQILQADRPSSQRLDVDLCRLFYGFELTRQSYFVISCINEAVEKFSATIKQVSPAQLSLFESEIENQYYHPRLNPYQLNLSWGNKNEIIENDYPFSKNRGISYESIRRLSFKSISTEEGNVKYVPASSLSTQNTLELFDKTILNPEEELVLEAVKIIEPDIIRLAPISGSSSSSVIFRGGIVVKSSKWEERIPIGSFGDGIWRLLGLALSLVGAKDGILLIDEIDTGLHHTVMSKMWKLICATARKLNVQVFATTHSRDCWETLADNAVEDEFTDMPIRIHRINKDKKLATTFTNEEMHLALNRDVEVR
ncbi:AAA family ATPase [Candidatus Electronema sp. TJ]|uniref:AAA family ATPase n=1 Tax=Candidatus Electronema sp. TJ TaxID=3401573 RepID=UPI003AA80F75